jgi:hypothetical protein
MVKKPVRERLAGREATVRWRITLIKDTPAKFLGYVEAPDEKAAVEAPATCAQIAIIPRNSVSEAKAAVSSMMAWKDMAYPLKNRQRT